MLVSVFCTLVLLFIAVILWGHYAWVRPHRNVPGPKGYFFIGNALDLRCSAEELFRLPRKLASQFQGIYTLVILNVVSFNIYNPEDIETLISSAKNNEKSLLYSFLSPWLGDGLLLSKGAKWHDRRKLLTPAFHFNILSRFCSVFGKVSQNVVERIHDQIGKPIDVTSLFTELTLCTTCETAMGTTLSLEDPQCKEYKSGIFAISEFVYERFIRIHLYIEPIFRFSPLFWKQRQQIGALQSFTKKVIKDRKESMKRNNGDTKQTHILRRNKHTPMLDLLIAAEDNGLIDGAGIQEEVDTFMFAGHDTTAAGLTFCLMLLANNENIQAKILMELENIFGNSSRAATFEDLSKMRYLECCIKESLRLYPPVPFISRRTTEEIYLSGYKVPVSTVCNVQIYDLHRLEKLYPNPDHFDPDRFLPENSIGRHPYAYIPFSAGPRNCIGQKFAMLLLKTALSTIIRRYKLHPVTTPSDVSLTADLLLRSPIPVQVIFKTRT